MNLGSRIRALRRSKNWTQGDLAAQLGLTKSVISAYETSLRYPSYDILIHLANIFKVSTDYLLGVEKNQTIDVSGLSPENIQLISQLVESLRNPKSPDSGR